MEPVQDTTNKKSFRKKTSEKLIELKKLSKAAIRMYKYAFHCAPWPVVIFTIITILMTLTPFIFSYLEKQIIDTIIQSVQTGVGYTTAFGYLLIAYIILVLYDKLLNTWEMFFDLKKRYRITEKLTIDMLKRYASLDQEYFENPAFRDKLQKVRENYNFRPLEFIDNSYGLLYYVVTLTTGLTILFSFSPVILLVIVITQLPELINNLIWGKTKWGVWNSDAVTRRNFWATSDYLEREHSLHEIRIFGLKDFILGKVDVLLREFNKKQIEIEKKRGNLNFGLGILSSIGLVYAIFQVCLAALQGTITIGSLTFYLNTINRISSAISGIFRNISRLYESGLHVIDMFEVFDFPQKIIDGEKYLPESTRPPKIEFKNVWFKYPSTKRYIFKDLTFTIKPEENLAIVGKNGAGKTTFVKLINRFYDVTKGEILIDGINIKDLTLSDLYKRLAVLSQEFVQYHFDAKTNIGVGNLAEINNLGGIKMAAKLSGADEFIKKYENGYDQILSKSFPGGIEPSTGQWQKIALARAFFKNAPILILDEPTSAIDPKSEYEIFQKLFNYAEHKTVIIISHRFSTVRNASKIIVLDNGNIIEQGTHKQLIKLGGQYKEAFELQKKGYEE